MIKKEWGLLPARLPAWSAAAHAVAAAAAHAAAAAAIMIIVLESLRHFMSPTKIYGPASFLITSTRACARNLLRMTFIPHQPVLYEGQ